MPVTEPAAAPAATKQPAPGALEVVRNFVNTLDVETGEEKLDSVVSLHVWLAERGLIGAKEAASPADLRRAIELREAIRALLAHNNGEGTDDGAVEILNAAAARAKLAPRFDADDLPALEPAVGGVDCALGRILGIVFAAMADGTWVRLKVCRSDTCQWAFYDWTKNHSGSWCVMRVCGNREKVRSFRSRSRAGARASS
jgi:predicted RNA-binding Zn ribbon-like protein